MKEHGSTTGDSDWHIAWHPIIC